MSLKGAGRPLDAIPVLAAATPPLRDAPITEPRIAQGYWHAAVAEAQASAGNATATLIHLTEALCNNLRHDRYWRLLVEVLGVLGMWDDAESVLARCGWDGCSFGLQGKTQSGVDVGGWL
jgi:hypothetical protein